MENVKILTKENYKTEIEMMSYGHILVQYESEEVREKVNKMLFVLNEYFNGFYFEQNNSSDFNSNNNYFVPFDKENIYKISFKHATKSVPVLHDDNFNIESIVDKCKSSLSIATFEDVDELYKYYKKVAKSKEVRFIDGYFDGRTKSIPAMKQIENAYFNGVGSISFKVEDVKTGTLRAYACSYGKVIGRKIKVKLSNGVTTLYLNGSSSEIEAISKIKALLNGFDNKTKADVIKKMLNDIEKQ